MEFQLHCKADDILVYLCSSQLVLRFDIPKSIQLRCAREDQVLQHLSKTLPSKSLGALPLISRIYLRNLAITLILHAHIPPSRTSGMVNTKLILHHVKISARPVPRVSLQRCLS